MADATDNPARPRRRRRWWLRVPLILIAFVVTLVVLVQIFLWTDYPRRIAETQITNVLRTKAHLRALHIGWTGRTRLEGFELTLPMEADPFLRVESVELEHTALPLLAFRQSVYSARAQGVALDLRQDARGVWNVESLLPPARPEPAGERRGGNSLADLPDLSLADARVNLTLADGRSIRLADVNARFDRKDAVNAQVRAGVGDLFAVDGSVGLVAAMPHEAAIRLTRLPAEWLTFLGLSSDLTARAEMVWSGRRTADGVEGTLRIERASANEVNVVGRLDVSAARDVRVKPVDLRVAIADGTVLDAKIASGEIVAGDGTVRIDRLRGTANEGPFAVEGEIDLRSRASRLAADWRQFRRGELATTGTLSLRIWRDLAGDVNAAANVQADVVVPGGTATGEIRIEGKGNSPASFTADLNVQPLTWRPADGDTLTSPRLTGRVLGVGDEIRLDALRLADEGHGAFVAHGGFDRAGQTWWATFDAQQLRLPAVAAMGLAEPIDLSVVVNGTLTRAESDKLYVRVGRGTLWANGYYAWHEPKPLWLDTWVWYDQPVTEDEAARLNALAGRGQVVGTVMPLNLSAEADVVGTALVVKSRPLGDVTIRINAQVTQEAATLRSEELELLGGRWTLKGDWSRDARKSAVVVATVRDLPARTLGEAVDRPGLTGTIDAGEATLRLRSTRLDQLEMTATAAGRDFEVGVVRVGELKLDAHLKDGRFSIRPVLREGEGTIRAEAAGRVDLEEPVELKVAFDQWPAPEWTRVSGDVTERFRPTLTGDLRGHFDIDTGDIAGDMGISGIVSRDDNKLADFRLTASVDRKVVTIEQARIDTLDGRVTTQGVIDLRDLNRTKLEVALADLTPSRLAWLNPAIQEVEGTLSGVVSLQPAQGQRPLGPLRMDLSIRPEAVSYRGVEVGPIDVTAFADIDLPGRFRVVTGDSAIGVAGGTVRPFLRLSRERPAAGLSQLVTADFTGLDLDQLTRAVDDDGKELTGRLAGRVQLFGDTTSLSRLSGDATITLTESDLANFAPIAALYDVLSVGRSGREPSGTGSVSLRVGDGILTIDDANYFNRGVYASGFGTVREIERLPDSPLDLTVFGSLQPLRAVKLPFFADLNDTLAALQASGSAIRATGTVKEPVTQPVSLNALGDTVQKALVGKTRER